MFSNYLYLVEDRFDVDDPTELRLLSQVGEWLNFVSAANAGDYDTEHRAHREGTFPGI
jgi:hypothetical protein